MSGLVRPPFGRPGPVPVDRGAVFWLELDSALNSSWVGEKSARPFRALPFRAEDAAAAVPVPDFRAEFDPEALDAADLDEAEYEVGFRGGGRVLLSFA